MVYAVLLSLIFSCQCEVCAYASRVLAVTAEALPSWELLTGCRCSSAEESPRAAAKESPLGPPKLKGWAYSDSDETSGSSLIDLEARWTAPKSGGQTDAGTFGGLYEMRYVLVGSTDTSESTTDGLDTGDMHSWMRSSTQLLVHRLLNRASAVDAHSSLSEAVISLQMAIESTSRKNSLRLTKSVSTHSPPTTFLVKQSPPTEAKKDVAEFLSAALFHYDRRRAPGACHIAILDVEFESVDGNVANDVYLASQYLPNFRDFFGLSHGGRSRAFRDRVMERLQGTPSVTSAVQNGGYNNYERAIVMSVFVCDLDVNSANIGLSSALDESYQNEVVRIDFGEAMKYQDICGLAVDPFASKTKPGIYGTVHGEVNKVLRDMPHLQSSRSFAREAAKLSEPEALHLIAETVVQAWGEIEHAYDPSTLRCFAPMDFLHSSILDMQKLESDIDCQQCFQTPFDARLGSMSFDAMERIPIFLTSDSCTQAHTSKCYVSHATPQNMRVASLVHHYVSRARALGHWGTLKYQALSVPGDTMELDSLQPLS